MLSQRRGEARAAPESDYSRSLSKGHCQPPAPAQKSCGKRRCKAALRKKRPRSGVQTPSALPPTSFHASELKRYKARTVRGSTREVTMASTAFDLGLRGVAVGLFLVICIALLRCAPLRLAARLA